MYQQSGIQKHQQSGSAIQYMLNTSKVVQPVYFRHQQSGSELHQQSGTLLINDTPTKWYGYGPIQYPSINTGGRFCHNLATKGAVRFDKRAMRRNSQSRIKPLCLNHPNTAFITHHSPHTCIFAPCFPYATACNFYRHTVRSDLFFP